jgi:MFS superfamily sulfate permease-like transporter
MQAAKNQPMYHDHSNTTQNPKWKNNFQFDLPAGLVVYLVALPLCLGIALASDAPLFAGILTGIVGGLLVSLLSGSQVSVSGPAAGLAVIVAGGIHSLESYSVFLTAVVLGGALQLAFGLARVGKIARRFPHAVITGMLAAIGLLILLKQIPHTLGANPSLGTLPEVFAWLPNGILKNIIKSFSVFQTGAVILSALCFSVYLFWEKATFRKNHWTFFVPPALLAVLVGTLANLAFMFFMPNLAVGSAFRVQLPLLSSPTAFFNELYHPDFSALTNPKVWSLGVVIALIASIETLLCIEATDKLDTYKRVSDPNRELLAQGTGNILVGLMGGIPMTSVIVRSSANIYAGGRTWVSCFFHGFLLLVSALFFATFLNYIPLASLAVVLILVGYNLTKVQIFQKMYREGTHEFLPFLTTVTVTVFSDLLTGVVTGTVLSVLYNRAFPKSAH